MSEAMHAAVGAVLGALGVCAFIYLLAPGGFAYDVERIRAWRVRHRQSREDLRREFWGEVS